MNILVAADACWGIGYKGRQQVEIPNDRKFFRQETTGKVIVLGRKTLETFPNGLALPGRINVILTQKEDFYVKDAVVVHSVEECLEYLKQFNTEDIFIVGGESIYNQFLPYCDTAHVTSIDYSYQSDVHFPNLDKSDEWQLVLESEEETYFDVIYSFKMYKRVKISTV